MLLFLQCTRLSALTHSQYAVVVSHLVNNQPFIFLGTSNVTQHMSMSPSLFFAEFSSCYLRFANRPSHTIIPHQQACGYLTPPLSDSPYWRDESIGLCHLHSHYKEVLFHRSSHYRGGQAGRGDLQVPSISAEWRPRQSKQLDCFHHDERKVGHSLGDGIIPVF